MGAAQVAAKLGALSADHLEYLSADGARALAAAGTVAVLLPTAYFTLRQTTPPPVAMLRSAGVGLAVATDSQSRHFALHLHPAGMNMACTLFGLTPEEALAGTTREAARALGVLDEVGTIEVGKRADLAFWRIDRPAELAMDWAPIPVSPAMHRGKIRDRAPWPVLRGEGNCRPLRRIRCARMASPNSPRQTAARLMCLTPAEWRTRACDQSTD